MGHIGNHDVLIDLLVPARFASRYRAVVTSLSALDAGLRFAFCPSVFGSGILVSCPATLSIHRGPNVIGARGILWVGKDAARTTARFEFEKPISRAEMEAFRPASPVAAAPAGMPRMHLLAHAS